MMLGFPSIQSIPAEQMRPVVAAYVRLLGDFSDAVVDVACRGISKREGSFAPSAGDLFAACERVQKAMDAKLSAGAIEEVAIKGIPKGRSIAFVTSKPAANF
jgi:hypothetical protein